MLSIIKGTFDNSKIEFFLSYHFGSWGAKWLKNLGNFLGSDFLITSSGFFCNLQVFSEFLFIEVLISVLVEFLENLFNEMVDFFVADSHFRGN